MKKIKVLMGMMEIASFFQTVRPYLDKYDFLDITTVNTLSSYLGYKDYIDYDLKLNTYPQQKALNVFLNFKKEHFFKYDIYDFSFSSFDTYFNDFKELKENNKYIVYRAVGSDIRNYKLLGDVNFLDSGLHLKGERYVDEFNLIKLNNINKYADVIYTIHTPMMLVKKFIPYYVPIDLKKIRYVGIKNLDKEKLKVIHSPTSRQKKGSDFIIKALESLQKKGIIEYKLIEGLEYKKALKLYEQTDIAIDQFTLDGFGKFTLEMLAMGKVVIFYNSTHLLDRFYPDMPVVNANYFNLEDILVYLNNNRHYLKDLSLKTRDYVLKYNLASKHAKQLADIYISLINKKDYYHIVNPFYNDFINSSLTLDKREVSLFIDLLEYNEKIDVIVEIKDKKELILLERFLKTQSNLVFNLFILTELKITKRNKIFKIINNIFIYKDLNDLVANLKSNYFIYLDFKNSYSINFIDSLKKIIFYSIKKEFNHSLIILNSEFNIDNFLYDRFSLSYFLIKKSAIQNTFLDFNTSLNDFIYLNFKNLYLSKKYCLSNLDILKESKDNFVIENESLNFLPINYFKDSLYSFTLVFYFPDIYSLSNFSYTLDILKNIKFAKSIVFLLTDSTIEFLNKLQDLNLPNSIIAKTDNLDEFSILKDLFDIVKSNYFLFYNLKYKIFLSDFLYLVSRYILEDNNIITYSIKQKFKDNKFIYGYIKGISKDFILKEEYTEYNGFIDGFNFSFFVAKKSLLNYLKESKNRQEFFESLYINREKIYLVNKGYLYK